MTPEERHQYNKTHAISPISYQAVCTTDAAVAFREWIEQWLAVAYEAGFNNAKEASLNAETENGEGFKKFVMEDKEMLKKYQLKRCYNVAN